MFEKLMSQLRKYAMADNLFSLLGAEVEIV